MSVPARKLPARDVPARDVPARRRVTTAPAAPPRRARTPVRRTARRFHATFWAMTAAIVTTIVVALVSVSALVVETGFGIDRTEARIADLLEEGERLRRDAAMMSAPGRIATWARRSGLEMPEAPVVVLRVPGSAPETADVLADEEAADAGSVGEET
ncbi:MAG TPA: hypothetical protein VLA82_12270 [Actinomycetota bacterium]|nr:hypothetical protein [Actinomycetota bacterium]